MKMAARAGLFSLSGYLAGCGQVWFGLVWCARKVACWLVGWLVGWLR